MESINQKSTYTSSNNCKDKKVGDSFPSDNNSIEGNNWRLSDSSGSTGGTRVGAWFITKIRIGLEREKENTMLSKILGNPFLTIEVSLNDAEVTERFETNLTAFNSSYELVSVKVKKDLWVLQSQVCTPSLCSDFWL